MILNATTKRLQVILGEAKTTTDCAVVADYYDSGVAPAGAAQTVLTNGVTAVDIVNAPASGYTRIVNGMTVENDDTVSHTVTVRFNDNGTIYKIIKATLAPGYTLTYAKSHGWTVMSPTGLFVAGQIAGTNTNDSAAAGMVGELMFQNTVFGSAVALTTATFTPIAQITLSAGDWNVWGAICFVGQSTTTSTRIIGAISPINNNWEGGGLPWAMDIPNIPATGFSADNPNMVMGVRVTQISVPTTLYALAFSNFASGTLSAFGSIYARRVR
jgi:hypothetical protein